MGVEESQGVTLAIWMRDDGWKSGLPDGSGLTLFSGKAIGWSPHPPAGSGLPGPIDPSAMFTYVSQ
jgi:hypothetical protein